MHHSKELAEKDTLEVALLYQRYLSSCLAVSFTCVAFLVIIYNDLRQEVEDFVFIKAAIELILFSFYFWF